MEVQNTGTVPLTTQASDLHIFFALSLFSWRSRCANPHSPPGKSRELPHRLLPLHGI